jgi:hypothetical protein
MKHTPGPWRHNGIDGATLDEFLFAHAVYGPQDEFICTVDAPKFLSKCEQTEELRDANARLIAAAPELLEALHTVCRELNRGKLVKGHGRDAYEAAVDAIAKAEGRT